MRNRHSKCSFLKLQKWLQVGLAVFLTGFFVLLLPGVGLFLVPLGCLYIVWAIRASSDHQFSVWLAFLCTLIVIVIGGLGLVLLVAELLAGQRVSPVEFFLQTTVSAGAAAVFGLHLINWRWLISPGTSAPQ